MAIAEVVSHFTRYLTELNDRLLMTLMENLKRVLIVCSVHRETGKATSGELTWLLDRLRPDVLFLECSPTHCPAFKDGAYGTLESAVVAEYRRDHDVMLEPVDLHFPDAELLKPTFHELLKRIKAESPRYRELVSANDQLTEEKGFAHINSPLNFQLESEIQSVMRAAVEAIGDSKLTEHYALWMHTHYQREREMICRIEEFATQTSFKKGVLLVGAAHRPPLMKKLRQSRNDGTSAITWDFGWHHEVALSDRDVNRLKE